MFAIHVMTLLFNGLTLTLAVGLLVIILWHDSRKILNQYFALFLFFMVVWNFGSFLVQVSLLTSEDLAFVRLTEFAVTITEVGFAGSSIALSLLATTLIGFHNRRFQVGAFLSIMIVIVQAGLSGRDIARQTGISLVEVVDVVIRDFHPIAVVLFSLFNVITLFFVWRYRRKIRSRAIVIGVNIFLLSQFLAFVNPVLVVASFASSIASVGVLMLSFALAQRELIQPLVESSTQVEAMHRVSLAISSRISLDTVLNEITVQATNWLSADAAGIFLTDEEEKETLYLATVYSLPQETLGTKVAWGHGVSGTVAASQETIYLELYDRDWSKADEFSFARDVFGSVICVPLIYTRRIIGVLLVIAGRQGRLLEREDVHRLELLGAQAAVAISHSQLFKEQIGLTGQLEAAHSQLETVLGSTENPVIAVDRKLRLIFANGAAHSLFKLQADQPITQTLDRKVLPSDYRNALRETAKGKGYVYKIEITDRVYFCHIAALGGSRVGGWVAVLNDVTQLMELDRLKSEMVRMASHDLKNPLMGAMAYLDLLRDDLEDQVGLSDEINESVYTVEHQLERMNRIIGGILDLERLKTGVSLVDVCQPGIIIENVLEEVKQSAEDKGVLLEVDVNDDLGKFLGDGEQFERAIVNLAENAIKFTLEDGHIYIRAFCEDDQIVFEVADNGVGIGKDIQAYIFDRFFRGQQRGVEHVAGSGLGLSLVKAIVENHNGMIWFDSVENVGTSFFVSVPRLSEFSA